MFPFVRPLIQFIQGLVLFVWVFREVPFYNTYANCIICGSGFARVSGSIVIFVCCFVNNNNDFTIGTSFAGASVIVMILGFTIGFVSCRINIAIMDKAVRTYNIDATPETLKSWNLSYLSRIISLYLNNNSKKLQFEKLVSFLASQKIERYELYILMGVGFAQQKELISAAIFYFKKAASLKPNFFAKFIIFSKIQEAENSFGDTNETKQTAKVIAITKKNEQKINNYTKKFWKELLNINGVNLTQLSSLSATIEYYVTETERLYLNVLNKHAKNSNVLRMYGNFLEKIKHDPEQANINITEAELIEEEQKESSHKVKDNMKKMTSNDSLVLTPEGLNDVVEHELHGDEVPESADHMLQNGQHTHFMTHQRQILKSDRSLLLLCITTSISIVFSIFLIILLIYVKTSVSSFNLSTFQNSCHQASLPNRVINTLRQYDFKKQFVENK